MNQANPNTSEPVLKTLAVLEFLAESANHSFSLNEISQQCQIPKSTLLRILNTLEQQSYVTRNSKKLYVVNFSFSKYPALSDAYLKKSRAVLEEIVEKTKQSAEILTIKGQNLHWTDKLEYPDMPLKITAQVGFERTLHELDSPARLYLKFLGFEKIEEHYDTHAFVVAGKYRKSISFPEAKQIIDAVDISGVEYDYRGNTHGIRRYATLVMGSNDTFMHLLCIAEAATPNSGGRNHLNETISLLLEARKKLEGDLE